LSWDVSKKGSENMTAMGNAMEEAPQRNQKEEKKIAFGRVWTDSACDPYGGVKWTTRDARISNGAGETIFEQCGVEVPEGWSQLATNVVVSKYFRGALGSEQRETSVGAALRVNTSDERV